MKGLGDLLELIYTARDSFFSIQATFRYWYKQDLMDKARDRWAVQQRPGSVKMLRSTGKSRVVRGDRATTEFLWRFWLQKPSQWRYETQEVGREASISVIDGDRWWYYDATFGKVYTNVIPRQGDFHRRKTPLSDNLTSIKHAVNEVPFIDPSFVLSSHALQLAGSAVHAGREAVLVKAVLRQGKEPIQEPFFWGAADEYELLVDKERGILLRYSARLDGHEYALAAADRVVFDESIPQSTFSFIPNPNTPVFVVPGH